MYIGHYAAAGAMLAAFPALPVLHVALATGSVKLCNVNESGSEYSSIFIPKSEVPQYLMAMLRNTHGRTFGPDLMRIVEVLAPDSPFWKK